MKAVFCICVLVFGILVAPFNAFAEMQVLPTNKGTVKVGLSTIPENPAPGAINLKIDFLNPQSSAIQEHIDYTVTVTTNGKAVFGPIPLTHTSIGTVTIPVDLKEKGEYKIIVDVQGVLFQPIPSEKATFSLMVGQDSSASSAQPSTKSSTAKSTDSTKSVETKPTVPDKNANSATGKISVKTDASKTDSKTNAKAKADAKAKAMKIVAKSTK